MTNTREKLIEILDEIPGLVLPSEMYELLADGLIANGVTLHEHNCFWATEQAYKNGYEAGKPKWIPVTERLPKSIINKVITLSECGYVGFGHYENYRGKQTWYNLESDKPFTDWDIEDCKSYKVTHWMPLPEAPKKT